MALIPATIQVKFTANAAGLHRVCYRYNNSGGYVCVTGNCTTAGAQCEIDINIMVDYETCNSVEIDGYAQALCEDISSLTGRVPFSVTFVPSPSCQRYAITCNSTSVAFAIVITGGDTYDPLNPPVPIITGGGGSGLAVTTAVGTGFITTTNITFIGVGVGCTNGTFTNVNLIGGTGTGAQGTVTIVGGVATVGSVTSPGTGYASNGAILTFNPAVVGCSGIRFASSNDYGKVISMTITNGGSGYTSVPLFGFSQPGKTIAVVTAVLAPCPTFATPSCVSSGGVNFPAVQLGQTFDICKVGAAPVLPAQYGVVPVGNCLCTCQNITIAQTNFIGSVSYSYTLCNGAFVQGAIVAGRGSTTVTACIVGGSLVVINNAGGTNTVTINGNC